MARSFKISEVYRQVQAGKILEEVIPEGADPTYWAKMLANYAHRQANPKAKQARGKTAKERGHYHRKNRNYAEEVLSRRNAL